MERPRRNLPRVVGLGAVALFAGLALAGVPLGSLLVLGLVLTCPLMMMAGMHMAAGHGGHAESDPEHDAHHDERPVGPRRPDLFEPHHHADLE